MSPGMIVRPRTSMTSASCGHESAPRAPAATTRSPSTTTTASGTGAAPVPSISVAPVNTRIIAQPSSTPPRVGGILLCALRLCRRVPTGSERQRGDEIGEVRELIESVHELLGASDRAGAQHHTRQLTKLRPDLVLSI